MRKVWFLLLLSVLVAATAVGDTLHLKNGSVLKGKVTSFADDQFIVMLDTGSGRFLSKATVYMGDVARIEFDSMPTSPSDTTGVTPQPVESPRVTTVVNVPRDTNPPSAVSGPPPQKPQPAEQPHETGPPDSQPAPTPTREPEQAPAEKTEKSPVVTPPPSDSADVERLTRKPSGPVKTVTVDVVGKRDWTSTGLIVKRGDRLHISATGSVILDPVSGRATGPEGISDLADPKKLVPDQPTGALIGVIGADNDDFIFIGRASEFTAARDGLLFLSVNEGNLSDNTGTYKAVIEVQAQRPR